MDELNWMHKTEGRVEFAPMHSILSMDADVQYYAEYDNR